MKALFAVLLILALTVVFLPHATNAANDCQESTCTASFQRTISTNAWGVTTVNDYVNLTTTGVGVSHLNYGIPAAVSDDLRYTVASSQGVSLQVSHVAATPSQTYTTLNVQFPASETKYIFNVTTVFTSLLSYSPGANSFTFEANPFPLVDGSYNVSSAKVTLRTGDWASPKIPLPVNQTITGGTFTCTLPYSSADSCLKPATIVPLNPLNNTVWKVTFASSATQNVFTVSAGRLIQISPSGSLQVTDSYNITNLGPTVTSVAFTVPKGVSSITESYVAGLEIDQPATTPTPTSNPDGTSTVSFTPSFGSVPFNQSFRAKISYALTPSTYISSSSLGTFTVNFALFNNVLFYEPSLQTKIVTPSGFRLSSLTGQVPQISGNQISLLASPVTPISGLGFSMTYQLDPFWSSLSPLSWVGLVEAALAGGVLAVLGRPGAEGAITGAPSQLITKFVELYDEKSSMRLESDKMEDDLARGALNRYDYKQRRRMLDRRMTEIDKALAPVEEQLGAVQGRYSDMIKRIERAEVELNVIKTTANDLRSQYRSGKISRDLYESLNADLIRRKQKAEQTIDTIIINLREEIR
jgi:archaellum component FlaC